MLNTLQAGRAIAAFCVVAFHLSIIMGEARYGGEQVFRQYTYFGHYGVEFFFVLSGFIILFAHFKDIDNPNTWKNYIYRRFVRLYPIYWLYTFAFVFMLTMFGGTEAKIPSNLGDWVTSLSLIRFTDGEPPLLVAWTLFHELAFYIVFSTLILNRKLGLLVVGIFMFSSMVYFQYPTADSRTTFNVYTAAYNLYFLLGMCAFWLYRFSGRGIAEFILGISCLVATLATISFYHELSWPLIIFSLTLILIGMTKLERSGILHIPFIFVLVGDASYTIYLTHGNLQGLLLKILSKTGLSNFIGAKATFFFVLVGSIALGCLAYQLIERPLLAALRKRHLKQKGGIAQ